MIAQLDWEMMGVVLGLVAMVMGGYGVLIGVVWKSHSKRVNGLQDEAMRDRQHFSDTAERIFGKIDEQTKAFHDFRVQVSQNFITKKDCEEHRASMGVPR